MSLMLQLNRWVRWLHVYSAVPVLLSMVFFAVTGFFLNHPEMSLGDTRSQQLEVQLPDEIIELDWQENPTLYSLRVLTWLDEVHAVRGVRIELEWEEDEPLLMLVLEGPNASRSVEVYPDEGRAEVFSLTLPLMQMLNNVHRVKSVSEAWRWFSDLSAVLMLIFCLTGFWLLFMNRLQRVSTISWVSVGSAVFVLIIYLMH